MLDQDKPSPMVRKKCSIVLKLGSMDDADFKFGKSSSVNINNTHLGFEQKPVFQSAYNHSNVESEKPKM